jgi:N-acetylglucosaminyldiphosphoundecaprenol N-acetyl-beta-D-mannosaminyltransferase
VTSTVPSPEILTDIPASPVLGLRVHHATMAQAVQAVRRMLGAGGVHQIVTANGAMLVRAAQDDRVRRALNDASLTVADGVGVMLAARILGRPAFPRVPGIELAQEICALAAQEKWRVFLLGAAPGVAAKAAQILRQRHPGLQVVGVMDGYFRDDAMVIEGIRRARPDLLFVALGFPRQDLWIASHREHLGVPVCMGVGGTLDVLAGRVRRAPRFLQRVGLEWAYRLIQEPRRWRVAISLPLVVALSVKERVKERWERRQ